MANRSSHATKQSDIDALIVSWAVHSRRTPKPSRSPYESLFLFILVFVVDLTAMPCTSPGQKGKAGKQALQSLVGNYLSDTLAALSVLFALLRISNSWAFSNLYDCTKGENHHSSSVRVRILSLTPRRAVLSWEGQYFVTPALTASTPTHPLTPQTRRSQCL